MLLLGMDTRDTQSTTEKGAKTMKTIKDYHGHTLEQTGYGNYPYSCIRKDEYPTAMIYECAECRVWEADTTDTAPTGERE